jgi:hypothetical protein
MAHTLSESLSSCDSVHFQETTGERLEIGFFILVVIAIAAVAFGALLIWHGFTSNWTT